MGGIVVHDQMHLLVQWHLFLQLVEKFGELLGAIALLATAQHLSARDVDSREESRANWTHRWNLAQQVHRGVFPALGQKSTPHLMTQSIKGRPCGNR